MIFMIPRESWGNNICLESSEKDSKIFGHSLALDGDYLAVGDPQANRVTLYQRNDRNQWERKQIITPPEDNTIEPVEVGFGYAIDLYDKQIAISSYDYWAFNREQRKKSPDNQDNFGQISFFWLNYKQSSKIIFIKK